MAGKTVAEVEAAVAKIIKGFAGAKSEAEKNRLVEEYGTLCEEHAEVPQEFDTGPLKSLRAHLKEVKVESERLAAKVKNGNPALGHRIKELAQERDYLVGTIRAREEAIMDLIESAKG